MEKTKFKVTRDHVNNYVKYVLNEQSVFNEKEIKYIIKSATNLINQYYVRDLGYYDAIQFVVNQNELGSRNETPPITKMFHEIKNENLKYDDSKVGGFSKKSDFLWSPISGIYHPRIPDDEIARIELTHLMF